ncbi:MAG: hypothetical protein ABFC38_02400 [Methanospirillum sp.]
MLAGFGVHRCPCATSLSLKSSGTGSRTLTRRRQSSSYPFPPVSETKSVPDRFDVVVTCPYGAAGSVVTCRAFCPRVSPSNRTRYVPLPNES